MDGQEHVLSLSSLGLVELKPVISQIVARMTLHSSNGCCGLSCSVLRAHYVPEDLSVKTIVLPM